MISYSCHIVPENVSVTNHRIYGCVAIHGYTRGRPNETWTLELTPKHLEDLKQAVRYLEEQAARDAEANPAHEPAELPQPVDSARDGGF